MTKLFPLIATLAFIGIGTTANANTTDALGLLILQDGEADSEKTAAPPKKNAKPSNMYLKADFGLNLLQDVKMRETLVTPAPRIAFRPGIDSRFGLGVNLSETNKGTHVERFAMEFTAGFMWNDIESISSNTNEFDPFGPLFPLGFYAYSGGEGRMMQVPLDVDFIWTVYETDRISISVNTGIGVQWTDLDLKNVSFNRYNDRGIIQSTTMFSASGSSVGFHYQAGFDVLFNITSGIEFGGYFRYSGTPASSMGKITGTSVPFGELKIAEINNFSVGARLTFAF